MGREGELLRGASSAIAALPGLRVRRAVRGKQADLELLAEVQGQPARLLIAAKGRGYPANLREAAWELQQVKPNGDTPIARLVAAPAISRGAREFLRSQGLGYWDSGGSLHLELPWAVYHLDRPTPPAQERRLRSPYRGASSQALHALLLEPGRVWHVQDLAERAGVSPYTAQKVLAFLEEQLWAEKQGSGPRAVRVLSEPGALLDAWAEVHSLEEYRFHRYHRWAKSTSALRRTLAEALDRESVTYALTLASGAELVAPFATGVERLSLLVPADADVGGIAEAAGLASVDEGENVVFLESSGRSPLLFRERVQDAWVASPVQLYLDLWAWPMRGKEQARHLRSERLPY